MVWWVPLFRGVEGEGIAHMALTGDDFCASLGRNLSGLDIYM